MTTAHATLKTLVQCRSLWLWHFFGLGVCLPALIVPLANPEFRNGAIVGQLIVSLWTGVMCASLAKDFISKPFSFALPAHQRAWWRSLLAIGLVIASLCSLLFLIIQTGEPSVVVIRVWQVFWVSLATYTAGVLAIAALSNVSFLPALITLLLVVGLNDSIGGSIRVSIERVMLANPVVTTLICVSFVIGGWRKLASRNLTRKLCGQPFLPLHSIWGGNQQATFNAERKVRLLAKTPGKVMRAAEDFFLARMRTAKGRTLWGTLYILAGKAAPVRASNLLLGALGLAALAVVLGFYHPERFPPGVSAANLVLYLVCAINAEYRINPHAGILLNISRRDRFWNLVFAGVAQLVAVAFISAVLVAVSLWAGIYLDQVTVLGSTWTYEPIIPKSFFFFIPMLPIFFICQVLFPARVVVPIMFVSIFSVIVFASSAQYLLDMSPVGVLLLQLATWLPFVALIRRYSYSWDLKLNGQSP